MAFLFLLSLYVLDDSIGFSDPYLMISSYCERSIESGRLANPPPIDWQTVFLGGILIGALGAALVGGEWRFRMISDSEGKGFFPSIGATIATGIAGGFLVMLGLQLAGDSFLGQWSSAIQLSTSAWVFFASLLVWGIVITTIASAIRRRNAAAAPSESEKKK